MRLENHIARRLLTDDDFMMEILETVYPDEIGRMMKDDEQPEDLDEMASLWHLLSNDNQKAYWITNTVLEKLDLLKIKKQYTEGIGDHYDWTFFKDLPKQKITFIFPDNCLLRLNVIDDILHFCHMTFVFDENSDNAGQALWVNFYVDRLTGKQCDHFEHIDVKTIEKFVYSLMAFFFLSENEFHIVEPGRKYGTRKSGKIINTLDIPITVVNNNWNVTSIRTEGFQVKGHIAMRWSGVGRKIPKLVLIEPFMKKGYVRKAKNPEHHE